MDRKAVILAIAALAAAALTIASLYDYASQPDTSNTQQINDTVGDGEVENVSGETYVPLQSLGDVEEVKDIIPPPYLELGKLYQSFPVVVRTYEPIDTGVVWFYTEDAQDNVLPAANVVLAQQGTKSGLHYYVFNVRIGYGYYTPGWTWLILDYNGTGERANLTLLAPQASSGLGYEASWGPDGIHVEISNAGGSGALIHNIYIANCGPETGTASLTIDPFSTLETVVPANPCPRGTGPLTGYALVEMGDSNYVDVFYVPPRP